MAEPFLSEIRLVSFNFAPRGWALANGQLMPINQNQALFSLLGTMYGGNGVTTFALPDYRGRVPVHTGGGYAVGQNGGEQTHTLTTDEIPKHSHNLQAVDTGEAAASPVSANNFFSNTKPNTLYQNGRNNLVSLNPKSIQNTGGNQPHQNMQPFLTVTFCVALQGIFPSPN